MIQKWKSFIKFKLNSIINTSKTSDREKREDF